MLLGIGLDLIVLIVAKMALEQDDSPDWRGLLIAVVVIAVINLVLLLTLGKLIGYFVFLPMGIVAVLGLMFLCQMTLRNALIAAVALVAVRIGLSLLMN